MISLIVLMMASCKKDPEMPSGEFVNIIKTNEVTEITTSSAVVSAYVGADCDERGVCWSTSPNPTISGLHTTNGSGIGSFTSNITGLTANTKYYVRAYATDSKGTSYGAERNFTTNDAIASHEYVDLGLPSGLLWAMCNVGADSPEDYGWYFMWGSVTSGGDPDCSWVNCPGNGGSSDYNSSAIATWDNSNLTNNVLKPEVDAASVNWGDGWRMPTNTEWQELINHTNCTWTTENGVYGRKFEGDNGNYVFLPAAGLRDGTILGYAGPCAFYWSSSLNSSNPIFACNVYFVSGIELYPKYRDGYRYFGFSVRPVCAGQSISAPAVTTSSVSNITQATATCGGNVTSDGGANVTARGICWSTSQNPTVSNSHTTNGSGTGSFTSNITGLTANTTYYVRAYATNSKGTSYGEQKSFTTNGFAYVDLDLPSGLLWATCNVGADKPEDYGDYFTWGETETKDYYDWSNYKWCNGSYNNLTKYCTNSYYGTVDNKTVLDPEDDAAHVNWGGGWRMPTTREWKELYDNTTSTWTTEDGVAGRKFTSKTDSSKYIFLPAAGYRNGTSLYFAGSDSLYWSSSLFTDSPDYAYSMDFDSGGVNPQSDNRRFFGFTVRPVR